MSVSLVRNHNSPNEVTHETKISLDGYCENSSWKGKFSKFLLKISVKAVLTKSSMRGFTTGKKGLQLVLIIPSRMLSEMNTTCVSRSATGPDIMGSHYDTWLGRSLETIIT